MAFQAGAIIGDLELRTSNFEQGIEKAEHEGGETAGKLGEMFESLGSQVSGPLTEAFSGAAEGAMAIGGGEVLVGIAALAAALAAVFEVTESVAHKFHEIETASLKLGIGTEEMSHLKAQAEATGTGLDSVITGMKTLQQRAEEAGEGNRAAAEGFARLGISAQEAGQLAGDGQELWHRVQGSISNMGDSAERTTAALGVMGRQGFNLVPMLTQTSDELNRMADFSDAVGATVTENDAEIGKSFSRLKEQFSLTVDGLEADAARPILQVLSDHSQELEDIMRDIGALGKEVLVPMFEGVAKIIEASVESLDKFIHGLREAADIAKHPIDFLEDPNRFMQKEQKKFDDEKKANIHVTVTHDASESGKQFGERVMDAVRSGVGRQQQEFQAAARQRMVEGNMGGNW